MLQIVKRLRSAGKLANAGIVLISDVVGRDEADVEDLLDAGFYLRLVNGAYKDPLDDSPLKVGDLPPGSRIAHRIGEVFKQRGINKGRLNHFKPAKHLLQGNLTIPAATLDKAETLFQKINSFI